MSVGLVEDHSTGCQTATRSSIDIHCDPNVAMSRGLLLIDKSLTTYDPAFIRGRVRLLAQKAEAYYGLGFIDESVTIAEEALILARSVEASKTLVRVRNLHTTLLQSPWRKERSIARLGAVLSL